MNLNLLPPPEQVPDDGNLNLASCHFNPGSGLNHHHYLASMASSSLSVTPRHAFFGFDPDCASYYRLHRQEDHDQNYVYDHGGSSCGILLNGKEENHHQGLGQPAAADSMVWEESKNIDPLNSSKAKAMKSKQKLQASSSSLESELSSNGSACVNSYSQIRVCTDCNTSKTPLWRSGPKGPKSLCNACGIRQRKARRAIAVAAHENKPPLEVKIEEDHDKKGKRGRTKKWPKMAAAGELPSEGGDQKKTRKTKNKKKTGRLEDFLIKLSNSLAFHKVFPQDEKDAAFLLMALSSGLVHS